MNGSTRVRYPGKSGVAVRLQLRDTAGNVGQDTDEVVGPSGGPELTQASATAPAPAMGMLPSLPPNSIVMSPPPPAPPSISWENPNAHPAPPPPMLNAPAGPSFPAATTQSYPVQPIPTTTSAPSPRVVASSENNNVMPVAAVNRSEAIHRPRGMLPPRQIVGSPTVSVHYKTEKVGPSGIHRVELWMTEDEGQAGNRFLQQGDSALTPVLPGKVSPSARR